MLRNQNSRARARGIRTIAELDVESQNKLYFSAYARARERRPMCS